MRKRRYDGYNAICRIYALCFVCIFLLTGCAPNGVQNLTSLSSPDETYAKADSYGSYVVADSSRIYEADRGSKIITMYLTVGRGSESEGTNHTWKELNTYSLSYYAENDLKPYQCDALLQVGDELGPLSGEFGYGELNANVTVRLRGMGASEKSQKSYRIDIKKGSGSWEDQKVILLNKHVTDPTRMRNMLAYALMEEIPEMFSARTWFVHLYVKDKSEGEDGLYQDYGIYTAVEQINKRYLTNRGLDKDGQLYKAEDFDWYPHSEDLLPATYAEYDKTAFERHLEIKGNVDHSKLLKMLAAVDDESQPITSVLNSYFDEDNLYYWMAFHMLMGNRDVENGNFYLYSPQALDTWYLLSWNNDGMLSDTYERLRNDTFDRSWNHGIFTYVSNRLYARILQDESCRERLDEAVEDLYVNYLTEEQILSKAQVYQELLQPYVYRLPDSTYQRVSEGNYEMLVIAMANEVTDNYNAYKQSLWEPWPFHILTPVAEGSTLHLEWEEAYLFQEGEVRYMVELSKNPEFANCILREESYAGTGLDLPLPEVGQYFLRVRADDGQGNLQDAYEYYLTEQDSTAYSTLCFYVLDDGSATALKYLEE